MSAIAIEIIIVMLLLAANGLFAMTEIAVGRAVIHEPIHRYWDNLIRKSP